MTSTLSVSELKINRRIKFRSFIRGHHVYKNIWSPYKEKKLAACPDDQEEPLENIRYAIGIYKKKDDDRDGLDGHALTEISSRLSYTHRSS